MRQIYMVSTLLLLLIGQTQDMSDVINSTMSIVTAVIPIMVLVLVLKLLFNTFRDVSKTNCVKRLAKILPFIVLIGQTDQWSTDLDIWTTITGIVLLVLPFLVLLIVLRSIFRYFTREW